MVDAYITTYAPPSLFEALLGFLKLYGMDMDYSHYGISFMNMQMGFKLIQNTQDWLVLIDPLDSITNVTGGAFKYQEICKYFAEIYQTFKKKIDGNECDKIMESVYRGIIKGA